MAIIFKNDVPYGGTVEDPYIRYNTITGKVQIKDAEGVWHNLMSGGLNDKALIPTMTTNTSPYGIASGHKINTSNTEWKAFDGDKSTYPVSSASGTNPYPYVQYTFDKEVEMHKVELWLGHQTVQTAIPFNLLVLIDDVWTNIKSTNIAIPAGNTPTSFIYNFAPQNIKGIRVELKDSTSSRSQFYDVQVYGKEVI